MRLATLDFVVRVFAAGLSGSPAASLSRGVGFVALISILNWYAFKLGRFKLVPSTPQLLLLRDMTDASVHKEAA